MFRKSDPVRSILFGIPAIGDEGLFACGLTCTVLGVSRRRRRQGGRRLLEPAGPARYGKEASDCGGCLLINDRPTGPDRTRSNPPVTGVGVHTPRPRI